MNNKLPQSFLNTTLKNEDNNKFIFVDLPGDNGGPTKGGVTQRTLSYFLGHPASVQEVKDLTMEQWSEIMEQNFWIKPGLNQIPWPSILMAPIFDAGVMSGPHRAIEMLQLMIGVDNDGIVGPRTIKACSDYLMKHDTKDILAAYCDERCQYYDFIVSVTPSDEKWLNGWKNRAHSFLID